VHESSSLAVVAPFERSEVLLVEPRDNLLLARFGELKFNRDKGDLEGLFCDESEFV